MIGYRLNEIKMEIQEKTSLVWVQNTNACKLKRNSQEQNF